MRLRIDGADKRVHRCAQDQVAEALLQPLSRAFHQRGMRRYAHRKRERALRTARLGRRHRTLHGARLAGDDDLPGSVVIHGFDHFALRGFGAGRFCRRVIQSQDRRHRTAALRHRLLHESAALAHQPDAGGEIHAFRADQRSEFAQAVSGHQRRGRAALLAPEPPGGDPRSQHGRLCKLGAIELLGRAACDELPEVVPQRG